MTHTHSAIFLPSELSWSLNGFDMNVFCLFYNSERE